METSNTEGQLTLNQMLKALDKNVASGVERRLKKLTKKKAVKAPLPSNKSAQLERITAYQDVSKDISKWDSIVAENRRAKNLKFPLDQQPNVLPTAAECVSEFKPTSKLEQDIHKVINSSESIIHDNKELSKAEEKYLKAISAEEAEERHKELQRMRVLLSSYAAKMRRQKAIKSKSYRKLLKQERLRKHIKRVESDKDLLMDEIEKLQKIRAQERASLRHKNTGKWAKHAKFRAKYDENARNAMLEQIGLAEKRLQKPAMEDSETDSDEDSISDVSEDESNDDQQESSKSQSQDNEPTPNRLIVSSEMIDMRASTKHPKQTSEIAIGDVDDEMLEDSDDEDDQQRKLMSEAFAGDDVLKEFKKQKAKIASEEQPKDIDLFLPGWGDWAGPGLKVSKRKRKKYIIKAPKVPRRDAKLSNVIISEQANASLDDLMVKKLPRGIKNNNHFEKIITKPTSATFIDQIRHRDVTKPRIETKLGTRIEPIRNSSLNGTKKAKWAV